MRNKIYKFSDFVLDTQTRQLYLKNNLISISSRAFEILAHLIERKGAIVEKHELLDKVWKDSFVEEANLPVYISALRKIFASVDGEFIKTISGKGYCFVAHVVEIDSNTGRASATDPNPVTSAARKYYQRGIAILESRITAKNPKEKHFQAIEFFRQALRIEPNYALAHVGTGTAYLSLFNLSLLEKEIASEKALKGLRMALNTGAELSEVYVLKGAIQDMIEKDFKGAIQSFDKAIELRPDNPDAYHWKGLVYNELGNSLEAIKLAKIAIELDPTNLRRSSQLVRYTFYAREFNQSIAYAEEILDFDKTDGIMHYFLSLNYLELGLLELAHKALETALSLKPIVDFYIGEAILLVKSGRIDSAVKIIDGLFERYPRHEISNTSLALFYDSIGDIELAFRHIYQDLEEHSTDLNLLKVDHRFKNIRKDSRFDEILKQLNLI